MLQESFFFTKGKNEWIFLCTWNILFEYTICLGLATFDADLPFKAANIMPNQILGIFVLVIVKKQLVCDVAQFFWYKSKRKKNFQKISLIINWTKVININQSVKKNYLVILLCVMQLLVSFHAVSSNVRI